MSDVDFYAIRTFGFSPFEANFTLFLGGLLEIDETPDSSDIMFFNNPANSTIFEDLP